MTNNIDIQQGLNQVVKTKVERMIENKSPVVQQTLSRLLTESNMAQDYIAPIGIEHRNRGEQPKISFASENKLMMNMPQGQFTLNTHAVGQLADKTGVPAKYLRELSEGAQWQRQLAANILNEHSVWCNRTRVLVRSVGNEVRSVLSDSYRRLNSVDILSAFLNEAVGQGAVACDALMTDTKVFVETILPQPICIRHGLMGR